MYSTYLSFFRQNVFTLEPVFDWFYNYIAVFEEPVFRIVVRNTVVYALGTIPITMFLALMMAVLLNENLGWIRDIYRMRFYPTMIPMAAAGMLAMVVQPWYWSDQPLPQAVWGAHDRVVV